MMASFYVSAATAVAAMNTMLLLLNCTLSPSSKQGYRERDGSVAEMTYGAGNLL
jgi:hypothetical protein